MKSLIVQGTSPNSPSAAGTQQQGSHHRGSTNRVLALIRRHPVGVFFVLSCALSWFLIPIGSFLPFGPLLAAITVVMVTEGLPGLRTLGRRIISWRMPWYIWAAALLVPLAVHAITIGSNLAMGAPDPTLTQFSPWYSVLMIIAVRVIDPTGPPLGEEPGWRGFAQGQLQRQRSPLVATAVLAVAVVIWHAPLMFVTDFRLQPVELLTTAAVTFWYSWLFNRSRGSVLATLVAHAIEGSIETNSLWTTTADLNRETWLYAMVWTTLALTLLIVDRSFWLRKPSPSGHPAPPDPLQHNPSPVPQSGEAT